MKRVETAIVIPVALALVWEVLTDFRSYPQWNPFIRSIPGKVSVGSRLSAHIAPPGAKGMKFRPTVLVAEPERELRWRGRLGLPGLFDGEHFFQLDRNPTGTLFRHGETFSGLLVAMMPSSSFGQIEQGFIAMNEALKREAERR